MYCPKCGTQNEDVANFCMNCGANLEELSGGGPTKSAETSISFEPYPPVTQDYQEKHVGFWIRVVSWTLDGIILGAITSPISFIFTIALGEVGYTLEMIISVGICAGLYTWYIIWMHGKYGQTLGKMAFGIKVLQFSGAPLTYRRSFVRLVGYIVNCLTLGIGYLIVGFKRNKRGLHDVIANTKVVYIKKPNITLIVTMAIILGLQVVMSSILVFQAGVRTLVQIPVYMTRATREGATMVNLAELRSAITSFYADNDGVYPTDPQSELVPKYIPKIPLCACPPYHLPTNEIRVIMDSNGKPLSHFIQDTGKWLYMADKNSDSWGKIIVDCTHTDRSGRRWCEH